MISSLTLNDNKYCFVCGPENKAGLRLTWTTTGRKTTSTFQLKPEFQGWEGIVHGGILATLMDEAMTRLAWEKFGGAVTAELNIRYHRAAKIGETLHVEGEVQDLKGRMVPTSAKITDQEGKVVASATGKAIQPKPKKS